MKSASLLAIATVALLQVHQAYSFYNIFNNNPDSAQTQAQPELGQPGQETAPMQPQHHHNRHHHGGQGGFAIQGLAVQGLNWQNLMKHQVAGGFGGPAAGMHNQMFIPHQFPLHHQGRKEFYNNCGQTVRHCEWVPHQNHHGLRNKLGRVLQQVKGKVHEDGNAKTEMEFVCVSHKHTCVGNTENCVSNRSCDVAMKISELSSEIDGKPKSTGVSSVSFINNCHISGQSVTDNARMPQMLFAIGFATYDEAGNTLECRHPKASDFRLIFLWKNSTVEDQQNGHCQPRPEHQHAVHFHDPEIMNTIQTWPTVCNAMENKEEKFNLKSFLSTHVPTAKYTSFFNPPFSFADNYEPQYSSNGMVISGVVPE